MTFSQRNPHLGYGEYCTFPKYMSLSSLITTLKSMLKSYTQRDFNWFQPDWQQIICEETSQCGALPLNPTNRSLSWNNRICTEVKAIVESNVIILYVKKQGNANKLSLYQEILLTEPHLVVKLFLQSGHCHHKTFLLTYLGSYVWKPSMYNSVMVRSTLMLMMLLIFPPRRSD